MQQSLSQIQQEIKSEKTSCRKLVEDFLNVIEQKKQLNAFVKIFDKEALQNADRVDALIAKGDAGRLAGMIISIKDNICYKGHQQGACSKLLEGFESLYTATAIERLLAEDVIIIGSCNADEFGMGGSNENSPYGVVHHPLDFDKVPGGSSGGSAVSVAAGMCHAAIGSDTGGSVRQPSAFCGTLGLKPTYGRISRYGLIAFASSFDQLGIISNHVEDASLLLEIMAGHDANDSSSSQQEVAAYSHLSLSLGEGKGEANEKKFKVAVIKECLEAKGLDVEIKNKIEEQIIRLQNDGHEVEIVNLDLLDKMVATYYILTTAEASSNLSRFTGVLYGKQSKATNDLESAFTLSRTEGLGTEVKRRIMLGTFVLSEGYYDAYYGKAQKIRRITQESTNRILEKFDLLLLPTTPGTAFNIGAINDPVQMYLEDIFTVLANLTGLPAINIPSGNHSNGLPIGLQAISKKFDEVTLLQFAKYNEVVS